MFRENVGARRSTVVMLGAAALAVCPALAWADGAPAGRATASASAITILVPGQDPVTLDPSSDRLVYPDGGAVAILREATQSSDSKQGDQPHAQSESAVSKGELFGGEIRFRHVSSTATASTSAGGSPGDTGEAGIRRLVVLGSRIDPKPGLQLPLGDWGTLKIDVTAPTDGGLTGGKGESATAIDVMLSAAHDGLPAGSEIVVGSASAAAQPPPPPTGDHQGSGGGSGGTRGDGGPPPGSPGGRTGDGAHAHPPAHHRRSGRTATGGRTAHHRQAHRRRPTAPPRPVVERPVTLAGGVRRRIVAAAESQIGWPYVWGGESEAEGGFDCSGLVDYAFAAAGRTLPGRPTAEVLWLMSQPIRRTSLRSGDLVFLLDRRGYAFHVGLYAGRGRVVVAAHRGAPVALQPLGRTSWTGFGRLWQARSVSLPNLLAAPVPPAHHHVATAHGHAAQPEPVATSPAVATLTVARPLARHPAPRRRARHPSPSATAARDEDLQSVADRPPRRRTL
jgi:cell wall-associated NlpC family hydrolase